MMLDSSRMLPAAAYLGRAGRVTRAAPKCSDGPRGVSSLSGGAGLSHGAEDGTGAGLEHAGGLCGSGVPAVLFGGGRLFAPPRSPRRGPGRGQPPGDQNVRKRRGVRIPFRVPGASAQEVIPCPAGQAGRSSDRHLTVGLDATPRQRASRAEHDRHAGCPWLRPFAEADSPGAASCRSAALFDRRRPGPEPWRPLGLTPVGAPQASEPRGFSMACKRSGVRIPIAPRQFRDKFRTISMRGSGPW